MYGLLVRLKQVTVATEYKVTKELAFAKFLFDRLTFFFFFFVNLKHVMCFILKI